METTRREILAAAGTVLAHPGTTSRPRRAKRVAGVTTIYHHNSHADLILSRLFQTEDRPLVVEEQSWATVVMFKACRRRSIRCPTPGMSRRSRTCRASGT